MIEVSFEIIEEDIQKYLKENREQYKYYEPLFIKYLKENNDNLSKEMADILIEGITEIENNEELCIFDFKPITVQNLDFSGLCHILIPAMRYYEAEKPVFRISRLDSYASKIAEQLSVPFENSRYEIRNTIDDYRICNKLEIKDGEFIKLKMSKENARRELLVYEGFYGEDKVKEIRKIVKKGVR